MSCKEIPVRIWIIVLVFMTRFLMVSIAQCIKFGWISSDIRYRPWCSLTDLQTSEAARIPLDNRSRTNTDPSHTWTEEQLIFIHDAQVYGQSISCILGGILAEYIGPFYLLAYAMLMAAMLNIGRAIVIEIDKHSLFIVEFVLGIHLGFVFPATQSWIARWAPPNERGVFASSFVGNGAAGSLTRVFFRYMIPLVGKPWVLYTITLLTMLHLIPFWVLGSNSPEDHKRMSEKELLYIKRSQRGVVTSTRSIPPYGNILKSQAFWLLNIVYFGATCSHIYFVYEVSEFLSHFMGIKSEVTEIIEVFPHVGFVFIGIASALLADYARSKRAIDDTAMAKIFIVLSHLGPGCVLLFMAATDCSMDLAMALLFIGYASSGFSIISCYRTVLDISPNYAGTIYGLILAPACLLKIIIPRLRKKIFTFSNDLLGWTLTFLVGGGCLVGTSVLFLYFGTARTQWWNLKSQDIYEFYSPKKPQQRPPLEGGSNSADASRIPGEKKNNNNDNNKGIDIDTEEWKPKKSKTPSVNAGVSSQPKVVTSRASEYKKMENDSVFETSGEDRPTTLYNLPETEHMKNISETDDRFSIDNTLPIVSERNLFSSEYLKGSAELEGKMTAIPRTKMLHETRTEFRLTDSPKRYDTTQKDPNYFDQLLQERSKSYPDLRWIEPDESYKSNKHDDTIVLGSALDDEEIS